MNSTENRNEIDVMVDLETLGTRIGSKILQLSAVTFNTDPTTVHNRASFNANISVDSQPRLGADEATIEWWASQDADARANAFGGTTALPDALRLFTEWCDVLCSLAPNSVIILWCKGAGFDDKLLEEAYLVHNFMPQQIPWKYSNVRCYRTLEAIGKFRGIDTAYLPKFAGVKHNALDDAIWQADCAEVIIEELWKG